MSVVNAKGDPSSQATAHTAAADVAAGDDAGSGVDGNDTGRPHPYLHANAPAPAPARVHVRVEARADDILSLRTARPPRSPAAHTTSPADCGRGRSHAWRQDAEARVGASRRWRGRGCARR